MSLREEDECMREGGEYTCSYCVCVCFSSVVLTLVKNLIYFKSFA